VVVHAPGSYLTYEPQWSSDVNSVYENITSNEVYPYEFPVENCPVKKKRDIDYVLSLMDWEKMATHTTRSIILGCLLFARLATKAT
jgi:hypothetical protein